MKRCLWCDKPSDNAHFYVLRFCYEHTRDAYALRDAILNASWRAGRYRGTEDTLVWSTAMELYDLENP